MNNLTKSEIDIPVAVIFFNRADSLHSVFDRIRTAKPSKLFLIQDGARDNNSMDLQGIQECRQVFDNIDWECEVYKNYSSKNLGCGQRVSSGISWVFERVDRAVIIEDDCIIEPTFFNFCQELLEKYKDDERITMISALNHFKTWDCGGNSYFFARTGAIAAWATWKRVWDNYDFKLSNFENEYDKKILSYTFNHKRAAKARLKNWSEISRKGKDNDVIKYWGPQFGYLKYKSGGMCIVPSHSLSNNVGVNAKATFSGAGLEFMKKSMRGWFFQKTEPMEFPLVHPNIMQVDTEYDKRYYNISYPCKISALCTKTFYYIKRKIYKVFVKKVKN